MAGILTTPEGCELAVSGDTTPGAHHIELVGGQLVGVPLAMPIVKSAVAGRTISSTQAVLGLSTTGIEEAGEPSLWHPFTYTDNTANYDTAGFSKYDVYLLNSPRVVLKALAGLAIGKQYVMCFRPNRLQVAGSNSYPPSTYPQNFTADYGVLGLTSNNTTSVTAPYKCDGKVLGAKLGYTATLASGSGTLPLFPRQDDWIQIPFQLEADTTAIVIGVKDMHVTSTLYLGGMAISSNANTTIDGVVILEL